MKCKTCGNKISVQSKFCPACGNKLKTHKYFLMQTLVSFLNVILFIFSMGSLIFGAAVLGLSELLINGLVNGALLAFGCSDFSNTCTTYISFYDIPIFDLKIALIMSILCVIGFILSIIILCKGQIKTFSILEIIITAIFCISNIYLLFLLILFKTNFYLLLIIIMLFIIYYIVNCKFLLKNKMSKFVEIKNKFE